MAEPVSLTGYMILLKLGCGFCSGFLFAGLGDSICWLVVGVVSGAAAGEPLVGFSRHGGSPPGWSRCFIARFRLGLVCAPRPSRFPHVFDYAVYATVRGLVLLLIGGPPLSCPLSFGVVPPLTPCPLGAAFPSPLCDAFGSAFASASRASSSGTEGRPIPLSGPFPPFICPILVFNLRLLPVSLRGLPSFDSVPFGFSVHLSSSLPWLVPSLRVDFLSSRWGSGFGRADGRVLCKRAPC